MAVVQSPEGAERLYEWICRQESREFHLTLVHVAQELCAQSLPVSAFTATRVIARQENESFRVVAALEKLKRRITDQLPGADVECRILNGNIYKNVVRVITEKNAQKLVLTERQSNFPTKNLSCAVENIAR